MFNYSTKNYILDPITCLCKVALLYFMPPDTRLGTGPYVLIIQPPNNYQRFERLTNGDKRGDISHLNNSFIRAMKWYVLQGPESAIMDDELTKSVRIIAEFTIKGLYKLQQHTYQHDMTTKIVLQYFINMIRDALDDVWDDDKIIKIETTNIISDKIKNNIDAIKINSIANILLDAEVVERTHKTTNDKYCAEQIEAFTNCAQELLETSDNSFQTLMKDINTS